MVGLPLAQVVEVLDPGDGLPGPVASSPSLRGVVDHSRDASCRWCISAPCSRAALSAERSETGVLVELGGPPALPRGRRGGVGALRARPAGAARADAALGRRPWRATADGLVPLLDLAALGARITETSAA